MQCNRPTRRIELARALLCAALLAGHAAAHAAREVLLSIASPPGTKAELHVQVGMQIAVDEGARGSQNLDVLMEMRQHSTAIERLEDGGTRWRIKPAYERIEVNGQTLMDIDWLDPDSVEAARQNGLAEVVNAAQGFEMVGDQATDGSLVEFALQGGDEQIRVKMQQMFEERIAQSYILFPQRALRVGDSWPAGKRAFKLPSLGRIDYQMTATLRRIDADSVLVDLAATDAVFSPDREAGLDARLDRFSFGGEMQFDTVGRRVAWQRSQGEVELRAPAAQVEVRARMRLDVEDFR